MILHTETSKLMCNWSFLFVVLHKPTLLPSTFNLFLTHSLTYFWLLLKPWSQIPLRTPYERFLTIYATVKNCSYGVRKGICDQGFIQNWNTIQNPQGNATLIQYHGTHFWTWYQRIIVLSSRTDFFVDMSGQISSRRRQLSTKQWSGNKHSDVPIKLQTSSYAMDHWDWPGKQWRAERLACRCTHLTACFSQTVKPFERLILSTCCFWNVHVSFLFQNSTLLCRQNRILVDMSYFLKFAVLLPILSTTALENKEKRYLIKGKERIIEE